LGAAQIPECQTIGADGVLRAFNPGIFSGPFEASGGDGVPTNPDDELLFPDSKRFLFQSIGRYDVSDYVSFFVDAKYVSTRTQESNQVNGFNDDIPIALDNPFIPSELLAQVNTLQAEGLTPSIAVSRDVLDLTARSNPDAERSTVRIVAGIEGVIPKLDFDYEVSYNYGRTDADITSRLRLEDRYFAAIDAVTDPNTGDIVCRSELDPTAVPPTSPFPAANGNFGFLTFQPGSGACVPANILGSNTLSQEAADFIFQPVTEINEIEQENIVAVISGDLANYFSLPAGPIGFATGYEYRRETSSSQPGNFAAAGLTFGTQDSQAGPTLPSSGAYSVDEFFIELEVPILEGVFLAESLGINGAYRNSNYDVYDTTDTWSVGSIWQPTSSINIRATYSEAVRVPNIGEAFSPTFLATLGATQDPCNQNFVNNGTEFREANCIALIGQSVADGTFDSTNFLSAFVPGTSGGNPLLEPEEAETLTIGVVYRPTDDFGGVLDGLVITADYYDIEIDGLIDSLTGFQIAQNCVDLPTLDNQFCDAIDRDPTDGFITDFRSGLINLGSVQTRGVDFRADYGFDIAKARLDFTINGTRFLGEEQVRDPSAPDEVVQVLGQFGNPKWIVNFTADYTIGDLNFGWQGRFESNQFLPGLEQANFEGDNGDNFVNVRDTGTAFVHDLTVNYSISEKIGVYAGVNNILEEEPFLGALSRPAGPRGRFFFVGLNLTL
jgi:outer membrane receptor protein involved in Fe transport